MRQIIYIISRIMFHLLCEIARALRCRSATSLPVDEVDTLSRTYFALAAYKEEAAWSCLLFSNGNSLSLSQCVFDCSQDVCIETLAKNKKWRYLYSESLLARVLH